MRSGFVGIYYPQTTTEQTSVPVGKLALLSGETVVKVKLSDGTFIPLGGITDITNFGRELIDIPNVTELKILLGMSTAWQPTTLTRRVDVDFTSASLGAISGITNTGSIGATFYQDTEANKPTGVDFLTYRGASFDGTDHMVSENAWNVTATYAFFIVFSYDAEPPDQQYLYSGFSVLNSRVPHTVGSRNTSGNLIGAAHSVNDVWHSGNGIEANYGSIDFVYCSYDGANFHTKFNGSTDSLVADTIAPEAGYNTLEIIGASDEYDKKLKGKIFRVIGFSSHQSDADIAKMEGWAAWAFDRVSELPTGHTYKTIRPII